MGCDLIGGGVPDVHVIIRSTMNVGNTSINQEIAQDKRYYC